MEADSCPARNGEDHLKLIFNLCDRDRDGFITAQDFRSLGNEHFGNTQVRERERERRGVGTYDSYENLSSTVLWLKSVSLSQTKVIFNVQ